MKKIELYPIWIRIWHLLNGIFFLLLIISGTGLHFNLISVHTSLPIHLFSGISLAILYTVFFLMNLISGNIKNYIHLPKHLIYTFKREMKYYVWDIFVNKNLPYNPEEHKFGLVKQIIHFKTMYFIVPVSIITGIIMILPSDNKSESASLWTITFIHTLFAYLLTIATFVHLYFATSGQKFSDFFVAISKGWILYDETTYEEEIPSEKSKNKKFFPVSFYNPITILGSILALVSFTLIIGLMLFDVFIGFPSPYIGIVTFIVLPSLMVGGLALVFLGALWENKKRTMAQKREKVLPVIDLNSPKVQRTILYSVIGGSFLTILTVFGSFQAYEYTDSDEFCGTVCHKVMHPEFTAYKDSPHSHVGCVKCHIGSGTEWYVRSKFSGAYQVYSVIFNQYSKPIPTPVEHLRPAQQTCEQCHWPAHFNSERKKVLDFFQSDSANSETIMTMIIKTGDGTPEAGHQSGIHWHMNIANEIHYYATDNKRQEIPWVKSKSRLTGQETIYRSNDVKFDEASMDKEKVRKFDCIDCHNRPSHIYNIPYRVINTYMANNKIDKSLPYIKNLGVQILESYSINRENSYNEIEKYIKNFYNRMDPQILVQKQYEIKNAVNALNTIYLRNYFPAMNANWKNYPNNIGHIYSQGCFRCHDGKHVSPEGRVISHDCNVCHTITSQKTPLQTEIQHGVDLPFAHPGGKQLNFENRKCSDCHGVKRASVLVKK